MKKLICLTLPLLIITGCSPSNKEEQNHNYHEIRDHLITWSDIFSIPSTDYLVYFYSERCGHCAEIKNRVIDYYEHTSNEMYFVCTDIDAVYGKTIDLTGIDNVEDFYIFGTPFLTRIYQYKVKEYYAGSNAILDFINNSRTKMKQHF